MPNIRTYVYIRRSYGLLLQIQCEKNLFLNKHLFSDPTNQVDFKFIEKLCKKSLDNLGVDNVDLYLANFNRLNVLDPKQMKIRQKTWNCLEELYNNSLTNAIGVTNFTIGHFEELAQAQSVTPIVNQVRISICYRYTYFLTDFEKDGKKLRCTLFF